MTPIKITDSLNTPDMANDGKTKINSISVEYATITPWSLNDKWLLLAGNSHFLLHHGQTGKFLRPLKASNANEWIGSSSQPRWSRTDPDSFYFLSGNSLKLFSVATMTSSLVRVFTEYSKIDGLGEGDLLSDDGSMMALCGDGSYIFTLGMTTLTKSPSMAVPGSESLYVTPRNNVLVSYSRSGPARYQGVELFDKNMRFLRQALAYNPHKDVALNAAGEEIIIHGNGAATIVATRLADSQQKVIFRSTPGLAEHVSCPVGKDFFFVDRYDPTNAIPGDIMKIWLDGKSEILCLHGSKAFPPTNKYTYQPKVSCNRDGSKLVFGSNSGIGVPPNYSDVFMLTMAETVNVPTPQPAKTDILTFDLSRYDIEIKKGILTVRAA